MRTKHLYSPSERFGSLPPLGPHLCFWVLLLLLQQQLLLLVGKLHRPLPPSQVLLMLTIWPPQSAEVHGRQPARISALIRGWRVDVGGWTVLGLLEQMVMVVVVMVTGKVVVICKANKVSWYYD